MWYRTDSVVGFLGSSAVHVVLDVFVSAWQLVEQSAPLLLAGFLLAGLIHALVPVEKVVRWLGAPNWRSVLNAAVIGTPLPLCSCSVVPVAASLRKAGASKGATTAFLISTPETGADSIALTYALMDPLMTVARPIAACLTAFAAGVVQNLAPDRLAADGSVSGGPAGCGHGAGESCCPAERPAPPRASLRARLGAGLRFGLRDMFDDLALYLVVGFLIAGALSVALSAFEVRDWLASPWAPLIMLAAGVPMYVCASSATPLVAVLVAGGLSPGAALVFLLAGPATNAASIVVLSKIMGLRPLVVYVASIAVCSLAAGYALDGVYDLFGVAPAALGGPGEHAHAGLLDRSAAVVLAALCAGGLWRQYGARLLSALGGVRIAGSGRRSRGRAD